MSDFLDSAKINADTGAEWFEDSSREVGTFRVQLSQAQALIAIAEQMQISNELLKRIADAVEPERWTAEEVQVNDESITNLKQLYEDIEP